MAKQGAEITLAARELALGSGTLALATRPRAGFGHGLFVGVALLPAFLVGLILWVLPVEQLSADRTALAARDYTVFWAAGKLAAGHAFAVLADPVRLTEVLRAWFGAALPDQIWPYPPPTLLLAVPWALLAFKPGFLLYTAVGPLLLWAALRAGGLPIASCTAVLLSPAVADNALAGQNGSLTAALLLGGLLVVDRRPLLAGILLGSLVLKPQLGILVPVCLLAGGRWQALLSAGLTAAALVLASLHLFGPEAWTEFLFQARPAASAYLETPWQGSPAQLIFASTFMAARSLGASVPLAYGAQAAVTLLCAGLGWRIWRLKAVAPALRMAVTAALAMAAAPWIHSYDMPPLAVAVAVLLPFAGTAWRPVLGFAWLWPGLMMLLPIGPAIPAVSVLSIVALGWLAAQAASRGHT